MRTIIISFFLLTSAICFGQKSKDTTAAIDSLDIKVISMRDFINYLERINQSALRQFNLTEQDKYAAIRREIEQVVAEADRKRKPK